MIWLTHKWAFAVLVLASVFVMRVFIVFPQLDLAISGLAYRNGHFIGEFGWAIEGLRAATWNMTLVMLVAAVIALSLGYTARWPHRLLPIREWNIIFWGFLLGPGLVVNGLLKSFSGRTRPKNITEFGGDQFFTAVGQFHGLCKTNCSFVSGEVSGTTAFCLAGVILLEHHRANLSAKMLGRLYAALWACFVFVALQRITSGGHFTSDALLAALYTALVMALLARFWPQTPEKLKLAG
jgi:lipid A 4'-phosphatase